jgi:hypothetical protein
MCVYMYMCARICEFMVVKKWFLEIKLMGLGLNSTDGDGIDFKEDSLHFHGGTTTSILFRCMSCLIIREICARKQQ